MKSILRKNYGTILSNLKQRIRSAQLQASLTVNTQLLQLYWDIGSIIVQQEKIAGWGAKVVDQLAKDLNRDFPDMKGLSPRNLRYMRDFALAYPNFTILQAPLAKLEKGKIQEDSILQAPLAKLPKNSKTTPQKNKKENTTNNPKNHPQDFLCQLSWYHHITLLDKIKDASTRWFYIEKTVANKWSRNTMALQIEGQLHKRQGKAITNFDQALPIHQSGLAKEILKNPYLFDFLGIHEEMEERELEKVLMLHIKKFLLELGRGFAYVGNQFNILIENDEYFLDLLFYNYQLHCFVVFELKIGKFKPEYAGKLNFYINTIDEQVKGIHDKPTIGVLLCKTHNDTVVKYALKGIKSPIGIAQYEFVNALPKNLKSGLPSMEELEAVLSSKPPQIKKTVRISKAKRISINPKKSIKKTNKTSRQKS
jgi:predicted nuclease of restriction endonuclease-like (RecB) superfamily